MLASLNVWTTPTFKISFNDIHCLVHKLVLNCARRQIDSLGHHSVDSMAKQIKRSWTWSNEIVSC